MDVKSVLLLNISFRLFQNYACLRVGEGIDVICIAQINLQTN